MGYKSRGNHPTFTHHNQNPKKGDWHEIFGEEEKTDEENRVSKKHYRSRRDKEVPDMQGESPHLPVHKRKKN